MAKSWNRKGKPEGKEHPFPFSDKSLQAVGRSEHKSRETRHI